ncbi:MAG: hypothetical protein ACYSSI_12630 [Planctomycetota bacterium]|jgi:hypothetical protein
MVQKMCRFNVLKCPKTPFGTCELVGSFETEEEAEKCEKEANKSCDDNSIIWLHKLEYEV